MSRQNPLSLVRRRPAQREQVIVLTEHESTAVIELGLRPTYALDCRQDVEGDVDLMLANAAAWMRAAEITSAGRAGRIPPELRADIAALLDEAIPEALEDLESTTRNYAQWRAGDVRQGFPKLGHQETEALYEEYIDHDRRLFHALKGVAAKLDLAPSPPSDSNR